MKLRSITLLWNVTYTWIDKDYASWTNWGKANGYRSEIV